MRASISSQCLGHVLTEVSVDFPRRKMRPIQQDLNLDKER